MKHKSELQTRYQAELLVDCRCAHGEGPVWDANSSKLFWVDLTACRLNVLDWASGKVSAYAFGEPVCAVAPIGGSRLLVAFAKRLVYMDFPGQNIKGICQVESDIPGNRSNDGKMDPAGRFWIGTMSQDGTVAGAGSLYRLENNEKLTRVLGDLTIANGMGWTADGRTMFFIDSPAREVWVFDFDPVTSAISNRRTVVRVPEALGFPDGMTVAPDNTLWVAHWGAGCVCHWNPATGKLIEKIDTGCPHTSSCCFSGVGLKTLFITTSRLGLSEKSLSDSPQSGGLYRFELSGDKSK